MRKKKKGSKYRGRNPTSTPAIDALIGDEEQTGKKEENKERNRERVSISSTQDPSVASYNPQGRHASTPR